MILAGDDVFFLFFFLGGGGADGGREGRMEGNAFCYSLRDMMSPSCWKTGAFSITVAS